GAWRLKQITGALADLAETARSVASRHLLSGRHRAGQINLPFPEAPERACGFVALALGKLGARELNYSSDIDLVLLFDPQAPAYSGEAQPTMARLARDLLALLSNRDADGYVFRVDLRLRPDPAASPAVIGLDAALRYYESQGRTWERAAFSKARPVAGDIALGTGFLTAIRPFIWRRHLDFAAIGEIHDMKRKIDARHGRRGLLGRDVKLGPGGIREIEFIVQTLSLVWGGQDVQLRIPATLEALVALAKAGHLPAAVARALAADYQQLRRVEHRLQMVADRQTHALPDTPQGMAAFTVFLGDPHFARTFPKLLARVHRHFLGFFDAGHENAAPGGIDPGSTGPPPPAFTAHAAALGFTDIRHLTARLRAWSGGQMAALRSERARGLLTGLLPALLDALGAQPDPDAAFRHFDTLLSRQRAGVQLLSLFVRNPALLHRLAAVLGAAPSLAAHLAEDAQALEALLAPNARFTAPKPVLRAMLREASDLEEAVAITRRFVRREEFHLSVATLEGRMDANEAGRLRSNLAQAALSLLLPLVMAAHEARYGRIKRAAFGIIALGKAGGGEMLAGSDLDLMMIYDHAALPVAPTPYFVRLSHALTAALTAPGPEGLLYKVDMRLRPSGNQGPVAVALSAFESYHAHDSWTWERLALTRARVMAASPGFAPVLRAAILRALARPVPADIIRRDTAAMRTRLATEMKPRGAFDVKHLPGGMLELGFIAEALQLIHGPHDHGLFAPNTARALRGLAAAGILSDIDAQALAKADLLWRNVQGIDRITGLAETATEPEAARLAPLLRATGAADLNALWHLMAQAAHDVQSCFNRNITPETDP
ncbi:MAG: bifunctional [glutamine synthetase] adenylyltransferase/[glutamine synthetase]-adenylyl-L-tyrosine phosphorylase, partial [Acidocella sp.]|nr:bifunctional [glutamine synthetase] adenylyltransferase/[glutamine synthetase]-adenylyl-L-tyrosine phosphorylase [Acidocella sp.]